MEFLQLSCQTGGI